MGSFTRSTASRQRILATVLGGGIALLIGLSTHLVSAQNFGQSQNQGRPIMRPVPRTAHVAPTQPLPANPTRQGWNLKWRRSGNVAPSRNVHDVRQDSIPASSSQHSNVQPVSGTRPVDETLQVAGQSPQFRRVTPAAYLTTPQRAESLLESAGGSQSPRPNDYFNNPFGDDPGTPAPTLADHPSRADIRIQDDGMLFSPPSGQADAASPTLPADNRPMNDLRDSLDSLEAAGDSFELPTPQQMTPRTQPQFQPQLQPQNDRQENLLPAQPKPDDGPSLGDMLKQTTPESATREARSNIESPSDEDDVLPKPMNNKPETDDDEDFENPFGKRRNEDSDMDRNDRDRLNSSDNDDQEFGADDDMKKTQGLSCNEFRYRIRRQTIDQVSLDISPPYRPDEIDQSRYDKLKSKFDEKQTMRQWRNIEGMPMTTGRLRDLAYEKAVIETEYGSTEVLQIDQLSEADLAYISDNWGLPQECRLEQVAFVERSWAPLTMTWKASNLCHNPLYFEDVNLERYGHTRGPVLEPLAQTAHFFGNIAILPYKMGVHCPTECQYSLGYYRPGNCAPWIKPPVPLSLKGAYSQAAVMTGLFWLVP